MFLFLYCANNNRVLTALKERKSERMTAASQDPSFPSQRESSEGARSAVKTRRESRESQQRLASTRVPDATLPSKRAGAPAVTQAESDDERFIF
jgi:hypothetical protein